MRFVLVDDDPTAATVGAGASVEATAANDWRVLCLSHRNDLRLVADAAEADGWIVAPYSLASVMKHAIGKPKVWVRSSASGLKFLAVGQLSDNLIDNGPTLTGRFCALGITPAEADVEREVAALISVPPNPSGAEPGRVTYVYRHTPQGLTPILGDLKDPSTAKAIQSSDVDVVQVGGAAKIAIILLVIPEGQ
jgi:hypothetical protein